MLADFGAAELHDDAHPLGDGAAGTPQYLAPERLRGARPSAATDLYGAGAILWEMAASQPFRTHADLLRGAIESPPLPAPRRAPALGPRLAAVVTALVDRRWPERPPAVGRARRASRS